MDDILRKCENAFYVFDIAVLKKRICCLRQALTENVSLCYAVKANTFIIQEIGESVERFEICSQGEAGICEKLGIEDSRMVISGVYKTPSVIEKMVSEHIGRTYTVESMAQLGLFKELSEKYDKRLSVLLRLTNGSQFGINREEIEAIIENRGEYKNLDFTGIQFFSGTQKMSVKKLRREIEMLDDFLSELERKFDFTVKELEYGTGFPVSYFQEDRFDEKAMLEDFSDALCGMRSHPKITLELGRNIAAACGKYYTHIVDMKRNKGENYIIVDGGMHQIVYFGQYMAMKKPFLSVCGKENHDIKEVWNICGSLCSMNDILVKQVPMPEVETGDIICFENVGAYCMTEGISLFLSRELPEIYIKKEDGSIICGRKRFETAELNMVCVERK